MNLELCKAVRRVRSEVPKKDEKAVELIYTAGATWQLFFNTFACRFACTMCYFGYGARFLEEDFKNEFDRIMNNFPDGVRVLVLESTGSFADTIEISEKMRRYVFERLSKIPQLKVVIIETHYTTVNEQLLQDVFKYFQNTDIEVEFEFGLESINPDVLQFLNKDINLVNLQSVVCTLYERGFATSLNLLLGAPKLTIQEQLADTFASIKWVMENCPKGTTCVIFPINVKSGSVLGELYNHGKYELIYLWEFIDLLHTLPFSWLDYILIAWWGNRANCFDGKEAIVYPYSCAECNEKIINACGKFYSADSGIAKKRILDKIYFQEMCVCRKEYETKKHEEANQEIRPISERFLEFCQDVMEIIL